MEMKKVLFTITMLLALLGPAHAAVVYTDTDDTPFHTWKDFDLDQNGSFDIALSWDYDNWLAETTAGALIPLGANTDNGFAASGSLALKMNNGDTIDGTLSYGNDTVLLNEYWDDWDYTYYKWGDWDNMGQEESAYLGFQFAGDEGLHYGWMQVRVDPSSLYITLFDMAWEDEAGKAILAGDMGSPVPVPGTIGLMAAGLLGLVGIQRKKKTTLIV